MASVSWWARVLAMLYGLLILGGLTLITLMEGFDSLAKELRKYVKATNAQRDEDRKERADLTRLLDLETFWATRHDESVKSGDIPSVYTASIAQHELMRQMYERESLYGRERIKRGTGGAVQTGKPTDREADSEAPSD